MKRSAIVIWLVMLISVAVSAAEPTSTQQALARWQGWRFGMFIHWGPASLTGNEISWSRGGEGPGRMPIAEYDQLYTRFNPVHFDADAWVKTAKEAGMHYLVITAKHADGFCLWPSKWTDYNISNTPFKRDVLKELSAACKRQGVQFCVYYCLTDWYHPDYPLGSPGGRSKKPEPNVPRYVEYVKKQTRELVENYGPLGLLWFDTGDAQTWAPENRHFGEELYAFEKQLQPSMLVNDRVNPGVPHSGDYATLYTEGYVGGFNRTRPWETPMVIGGHWAWDPHGKTHYLSLRECLHWLLRVAGNDGNFLLNVGPNADGRIEPEHVARLKEMGAWLAKNGQGVYGTRGGPFKAARWGASTCKDNTIYLYIMNWPAEGPLLLPAISAKITASRTVSGGKAKVVQREDGITVDLPPADRSPLVTVVKLTVKGKAFDIPPVSVLSFTQAAALRPQAPPRSEAITRSLQQGRLGHWHLDDGVGAVAKASSPDGKPGTITGTPGWAGGKFGKAVACGRNTALELGAAPMKQGMSVSLWVNAAAPGFTLFQQPEVCRFGVGDACSLGFNLTDSEGKLHSIYLPNVLAFTFDAWHHLAATYDGAVMRIYVDGEEQGAGLKAQFTIKESTRPFQFGWHGENFPVMYDEVMLYDRALTKEEVEALATAKTGEE
ncbi:MAG: alpha-L-fucosidase [Armatimonadota bacterium]